MNTKCLFNKKTPEGMVSVSQLQTYMSCAKKWEYAYRENLTPRIERPYLSVGKLCHKGMQVAMRCAWQDQQANLCTDFRKTYRWEEWRMHGLNAMVNEWTEYMDSITYLQEEIPDLEKILADAETVFTQAFEEFEPWKYRVLSVTEGGKLVPALELHFLVPMPNSKGLHGFIDAILQDVETGFTWCTDYKFRKSLSPDEEEATNIQNAVYSYACAKMGIDITGTMTWQHVNTPAALPQLLKNGGVSKAKIKTTWAVYEDFCLLNDIDPEPYREEMEEKLADIEWFRATYEYRNPETVERMMKECVEPATRAVRFAKNHNANNYRSLYPWNCKMCQFKDLCQAELRGYDAQYIKTSQYTVRTHGKGADNKPIDMDTSGVV